MYRTVEELGGEVCGGRPGERRGLKGVCRMGRCGVRPWLVHLYPGTGHCVYCDGGSCATRWREPHLHTKPHTECDLVKFTRASGAARGGGGGRTVHGIYAEEVSGRCVLNA